VLVAIYLLASAVGAMTHVELFGSEDVAAPVPKAHAKKRHTTASSAYSERRRRTQLVEQITERNPFCPTCDPEQAKAAGTKLADAANGPGGQWVTWSDGTILGALLKPGEQPTALPLRLVATMQAVPAEAWMATIAHTEQPGVGVFARGDTVVEGVQIYRVTSGLVHLDNGGRLEYLPLAEPKTRRSRSSRKTSKRKQRTARRKSKYEIDGARDAIKCEGKSSCTIDRAFVSKLIKNPSLLARQARIRPSRRNAEMRGFKVYGVRRGTIPRLLQLRNGIFSRASTVSRSTRWTPGSGCINSFAMRRT
jgi:general secretion pathway protein C